MMSYSHSDLDWDKIFLLWKGKGPKKYPILIRNDYKSIMFLLQFCKLLQDFESSSTFRTYGKALIVV